MTEKPRCPLRMAGFDQPDTCDPACALLMQMNDYEQFRMCAFALIARKQAHDEWMPVNYWNEVNDGKD